MSRLIDADALCRTISLHIMAYKTLLNNKITIPNQIDKEKVNSVIDGFRECIDIVYYEPRVIAEHIRHGHWTPYEYGDCHWHKCSVCGVADKYIETVHRDGYPDKDLECIRHYCPNCGAKMDEVKE